VGERAGSGPGTPEGNVLRQALFARAFNPATRDTDPPAKIADALDWAERASLPVAELEDTATVRVALAACARTLAGKPAAESTQRRIDGQADAANQRITDALGGAGPGPGDEADDSEQAS